MTLWLVAHWPQILSALSSIYAFLSEVIPFVTSGKATGVIHLIYNIIVEIRKVKHAGNK